MGISSREVYAMGQNSIRRRRRKNKAGKVGAEKGVECLAKTALRSRPRIIANGKNSQEGSKGIADRRGGKIHHEGIRRAIPPGAGSIAVAAGEDDEARHCLERNSHENGEWLGATQALAFTTSKERLGGCTRATSRETRTPPMSIV